MSSQCEECGIQNIDDLDEEYNWCNPCLENFKIFLNLEAFINHFGEEKNEKIDNLIQEMQSKIKGPSDIIFEWIPYNQFNNISEEGKGDYSKACSAIWKNGPLTYSYFKKQLVRVSNKKVVLKYLFNSKDIIDKFLDEVKTYSINYTNNIRIYGISQDPKTKDYIIVLNANALKQLIDDFNEKLIKDKTKEHGFNYFEYNKFNNPKEIGEGGFGIVKKAKTDGNKKVVLKRFIDKNSKIENVISNYVKELELFRMVHSCSYINRFLGITKDDIGYIMVFECANEGNLRNYLKKKINSFNSLQWKDKIKMAFDITCGLKYLHSKRIIHRDLHSNNILVNNGKLLIADYGLSKRPIEVASSSMSDKMGIEYIEPQCFKDSNYKRNEKSDIYSLGVLFWEISSGRPPFSNRDASELYNHINDGLREEPFEGTPSWYQQLYQKCWDGDPEKRPSINEVYKIFYEINEIDAQLHDEEWIKEQLEKENIHYFEYRKFNEIKEIGKGGFGVVKKALTDDGSQVALKSLIENNCSDIKKSNIQMFVKELRNLRKVSIHENIIDFRGVSKDHDENYIMVLGYANGGNLRSYLEVKHKSLHWEKRIQMALNITRGLKCLHSNKIIHRDLHSKNILVNNDTLLIADFGLSKHITEATSKSMNLTGIIEYVDPQCFKDFKHKMCEKSDIYSLGVLFWEITSGRPPFSDRDDQSIVALCNHIGSGGREEPTEGTPLEYQQLYQKCWNDDPKKRPDIDHVYYEISRHYNANGSNEQEDSLAASTSSRDSLNKQSDQDLYLPDSCTIWTDSQEQASNIN